MRLTVSRPYLETTFTTAIQGVRRYKLIKVMTVFVKYLRDC